MILLFAGIVLGTCIKTRVGTILSRDSYSISGCSARNQELPHGPGRCSGRGACMSVLCALLALVCSESFLL